MLGGFEPSLTFLNQSVPLWFALLMAFTAPHLWAKYAKDTVKRAVDGLFGSND